MQLNESDGVVFATFMSIYSLVTLVSLVAWIHHRLVDRATGDVWGISPNSRLPRKSTAQRNERMLQLLTDVRRAYSCAAIGKPSHRAAESRKCHPRTTMTSDIVLVQNRNQKGPF